MRRTVKFSINMWQETREHTYKLSVMSQVHSVQVQVQVQVLRWQVQVQVQVLRNSSSTSTSTSTSKIYK